MAEIECPCCGHLFDPDAPPEPRHHPAPQMTIERMDAMAASALRVGRTFAEADGLWAAACITHERSKIGPGLAVNLLSDAAPIVWG